MVLGSDVPLREDILRKPTEFVKTWLEWSADNREQVIVSRGTTGKIFVVPNNKTFFVTGAWATLADILTTNNPNLSITIGSSGTRILGISSFLAFQGVSSNSISFPMPIKVQSGDSVDLGISTNASGLAGINGFILPKRIV